MKKRKCSTYNIRLFVTGKTDQIQTICSKFCKKQSYCVSLDPRRYIYNGGIEDGLCIEFINYARFQDRSPSDHLNLAKKLAKKIIKKCAQNSCSVITPEKTYYYSQL